MTTRLDRLFLLLDTGSSPLTRKTAAQQLGEVQKLHPHELPLLLGKVHTYLKSQTWETRIAASQAVEAILSNVPQWDPQPSSNSTGKASHAFASGRLTFSQFDINKILQNRSFLTASEGKEFDDDESYSHMNPRDRITAQRQALNQKLGLDLASKLGIDTGDIFSNEDLESPSIKIEPGIVKTERDVESSTTLAQLSSREANRAKRKARLIAKQKSRDTSQDGMEEPSTKKIKKEKTTIHIVDSIPDPAGSWPDSTLFWPFESFCDILIADLFSLNWETRHGAGTALREVIKLHGKGAGKSVDVTLEDMTASHELWLEDMSLRLLCVLALDRFGDFVSDQVVAPVRETCAQALSSVANLMTKSGVVSVIKVLLQLLQQREWEARHGGLLGLKYLMAVRQDLSEEILPLVYSYLSRGLQDDVDDVGAVAAAALVPLADTLVNILPFEEVNLLQRTLWDSLLELDELSGSTSSILSLLSSLVSHPSMAEQLESLPLVELVPRLWPFLSHSSSAVRKSTFKTLLTLVNPQHQAAWLNTLATDTLRFVFQCALLEHVEEILNLIKELWQAVLKRLPLDILLPAACPFVATWLCLLMQPSRTQFDPAALIFPEIRDKASSSQRRRTTSVTCPRSEIRPETKLFIAGADSAYENSLLREKGIVRARCLGAVMLGMLSRYLVQPMPGLVYTPEMESPLDCYSRLLLVHLNSRTSVQRTVVAHVIAEWAERDENTPTLLMEKIHQCLNEAVYYDEIALAYTKLLHDAKDYIATLKHYKLPIETAFPAVSGSFLSLEQIQQIAGPISLQLFTSSKLKSKLAETLEERRKTLASSSLQVYNDQTALNNTTQAALARAMVSFRYLPEKLNPVIKPLMDAIKTEENEQLQEISARTLAHLIELCLPRNPCPNAKIIKNLCSFLCADPDFTPRVSADKEALNGIISLQQQQKEAEKASSSKKQTNGEESQGLLVQRRGASLALRAVVCRFGRDLPAKVPVIWEQLTTTFSSIDPSKAEFNVDLNEIQDLIQRLQVFESTCTAVNAALHSKLMELLPKLCLLLQHPFSGVRHMVSRCLAALGSIDPTHVLTVAVEKIIPMLGAVELEKMRQGSIEALSCLVEQLGLDILPFIVLLVIPVLGRMSDTEESVRLVATQCFATLVRLMPLEGGVADPPNMSQQLSGRKIRERKFLEQLFDPKKMENYRVHVPISAELRSYQQEGVNWLAFLNKYKLHGILCDDMGLGKTLQTICIIASDHFDRDRDYAATKSPDAAPLPSIVVCPPTLTGHWVYEIEKFVSSQYLNPLHYSGPPMERNRLRARLPHHNIVVVSYDIVRNDIEFFSSIRWNYCVLDEGHVIKNGKTKASKAIKQLIANHRLILSGTPIQNNVLELWSLFDFLIPGFLGSERQFQARYSKPILASRDAKASSKEQEAGALALEALHRQTLPFLLRRMKEDVLKDLPPKITQDYYCDLSPLQVQLYEDFAKKHAQLEAGGGASSQSHIFQALQYLRKVCNHPKLVLTPQHPEYENVMKKLKDQNSNLTDIQVASKLPALRQLLLDCGIGTGTGNQQECVVSQHRALIFCQLKSMLDIIEKDLFKQHMPSVSYMRLDGSVPAGSRHSVVKRFNEDPSIDVLLLTTQVGGLGLNLTGADTVIFVEHDWNPMKDLQAMDRAHRIGQKRVVNVYRLITKATLEEKIMGLQKFKLKTANAIISSENASLQSMGTDQLLDLFSLEERKAGRGSSGQVVESGDASGLPGSFRVALESLPELWNEDQYENEYNLDAFIASLKP